MGGLILISHFGGKLPVGFMIRKHAGMEVFSLFKHIAFFVTDDVTV